MKKGNFRKAIGSLWIIALVAAFCFLSDAAFAGNVGAGGVGDATGTVSATTACATNGGDFTAGTGILLLDEGLGPASGMAAVVCNISGSVGTGAAAIDDPASIDGGAISDILEITSNGSGGSTVSLFSVGDNGFTQADANAFSVGFSFTEFNVNGGTSGYTVFDSGDPGVNGGRGTCSFSSAGTTLTLSGCSNNGYIINSPESPQSAPEPSSVLLLGIMLVAGLAFGKRVFLPESR